MTYYNKPLKLDYIFTKVRKLTGSGNSSQLSDHAIQDYINLFYSYDLPSQFRSLKLKDKYTFTTQVGIDTYPFDSEHYTTVEMPVYCAKREIALFNDPWSFYGVNFNWQQQTNFAFGNGTTGPYSGLTTAKPVIRSYNNDPGPLDTPSTIFPIGRNQNILITANTGFGATQNVTDDGSGNLIQILPYTVGDPSFNQNAYQNKYGPQFYRVYASVDPTIATGTIDYETGEISDLYFQTAIPSGVPIQIQYNYQVLNIPLSIMFFQNQFTLRPIPDKGYTIEMIAYRQPLQALLSAPASLGGDNGIPELSEWIELLAVGAAKKIYEDRLDSDGLALMDKMLFERYQIAETRTYAQLGKQRISTIYADQLQNNYGSRAGWFGSN